ncbi:hypothetical protein CLOM_g21206 [Closterium sp. NIES-68]|nr:hypothetical protein CLOM_g21206 [Closterium sp. NIES-68]
MDGDDTVQTDGRNDVSDAASAVEQRACDAREQGLGWEEAEECGVARGGSDGAAAGGRAEAGSAVTTPRSAAFRVAELPAPRANGGACVEREDYRDGGSGATEAREASHVDGGEEDLTAGIATSTRGIAFSPLHPAPSPSPLLGSTDDLRLPAASSSPRAVAEACAWAVREDDSGLAVASSTDEMSVRMEVGAAVQERLVGVRSHAVYRMRVLVRRGREWEVERRFRELVALQHHMSALLDGPLALPYSPLMHSHALSPPLHRPPQSQPAAAPSPVAAAWQAVREEAGRFLGGASGPAVQRRCEILQATLSALLAAGPPLSTAPPLLSFLAHPIMQHSPWAALAPTPAPDAPSGAWAPPPLLQGAERGGDDEASVQRQMLLQRHCCAACRRPLLPYTHAPRSSASALLFFQPLHSLSLPMAAPRLCHYTGRIFCGACQGSERCPLPGLVLRHWCFDDRPVCQLAKAYLDSTHDQPLLCLSAVSPLLPRRVPVLAHIQRLRAHLAVLHAAMGAACPLRRHLVARLGARAYLVQRESEGFFAMRDLVDASKGRFAVLPDMLARLASSLRRHMASGCIECAAAASTHCTAQTACCSPFGPLIFPYEASSTSRCQHCSASYHSCCLRRTRLCLLCANPIQPSATPRPAASAPLVAPSPPTAASLGGPRAAVGSSQEHHEEASGAEQRAGGGDNGQGGAGGLRNWGLGQWGSRHKTVVQMESLEL